VANVKNALEFDINKTLRLKNQPFSILSKNRKILLPLALYVDVNDHESPNLSQDFQTKTSGVTRSLSQGGKLG